MILYVIIGFILFLLSTKKTKKYTFFGSIFFLTVLAGLRKDNIGYDTHVYKDIFLWIKDGIDYPIEPGWYVLNKLVILCGGGFNLLLWITSLLTLFPIGFAIIRSSPNPQLSLFFYYALYAYLNSFNGMRQFIAISFVLFAYSCLPSIKRFVLFILFAVSFHISAVFAFLVLLYKVFEMKNTVVALGLIFSFFCGLILNNNIIELFAGPYAQYLDSDFGYRENLLSTIILLIVMNILFCWCFYTSKKEFKQTIWTKIFFIAIILLNVTMQLQLGTRIVLYFTLIQIVYFPNYYKNTIVKNKFIIQTLITMYVTLVFFKILILGNLDEYSVYPYMFFFE